MPEFTTLVLFSGAALVLLVTPGPAVMYVVAQSIAKGPGAGVVSSLGLGVGGLVHVAAGVLGLSALLLTSDIALVLVRLGGAAYLISLGVGELTRKSEGTSAATQPTATGGLWATFRQGIVVNVTNPKAALFFLAFFPQFIDPEIGHQALQFLVLGVTFSVLALASDTAYALLAGEIGARLRTSPRAAKLQRIAAGVIYLVLGFALFLSGGVGGFGG